MPVDITAIMKNIHINQNIFDNLNEYALTPLKSKYTFITKINL